VQLDEEKTTIMRQCHQILTSAAYCILPDESQVHQIEGQIPTDQASLKEVTTSDEEDSDYSVP
jgi:hypothetical protein